MSLFCKFGRHDPSAGEIWNNGYFFTRCEQCQKPLLRRRGGSWEEAPKGFKIIWKERKGPPIEWKPWRADDAAPAPAPIDEDTRSVLSLAGIKSRLAKAQIRSDPSLTDLAQGTGAAANKAAASG